jgi:uncharacterized integral membrane protein (TIGR00697 family)
MKQLLKSKPFRLFLILASIFITNALVAEFIGVKIFSLDESLGIGPIKYKLFGMDSVPQFTVGVLLWPFVFILTDIINEYFGIKGVRLITNITVALISYAFLMVYLAISVVPADWWLGSYTESGVADAQVAYQVIYGQGIWIIAGSLIAFLVGQVLDVLVFHRIKQWTGEKKVWLRATGSTFFSQLIDSFLVIYIAFVLGPAKWSMDQFAMVATNNYLLKIALAILMTPLIYLAHYYIDKYLGKAQAAKLRQAAMTK